jgi:DNA-binding transcriptional MerR regulator
MSISLSKSTRAFRTISEAGDELGLQPHVLRFWESKFSEIQPMKRRGGRRFYRPEDIEFLRGIKVLLHREKHPIKDVQKLIRVRGAQSVRELGRSVEQAATPKDIKDTNLVPQRIKPVISTPTEEKIAPIAELTEPVAELTDVVEDDNYKDEDIVRRVAPVEAKLQSFGIGHKPAPVDEPKDVTDQHIGTPIPDDFKPDSVDEKTAQDEQPKIPSVDRENLKSALERLQSLKQRWDGFK